MHSKVPLAAMPVNVYQQWLAEFCSKLLIIQPRTARERLSSIDQMYRTHRRNIHVRVATPSKDAYETTIPSRLCLFV
jgi:hypothetical protein